MSFKALAGIGPAWEAGFQSGRALAGRHAEERQALYKQELTRMPMLEIYADTRGKARCLSCDARIQWAEMKNSGRKMPFDGEIVPVRSYHAEDGRLVEVVDSTVTTSHFSSCPQGDSWRRK